MVPLGKRTRGIDWVFDLSQFGWGIEPVVGGVIVVRAVVQVVVGLTFAAALPEAAGVGQGVEVKNSVKLLASLHTPNVRWDPC